MDLGSRLIEAEQDLAKMPELEFRLRRAEEENERLRGEVDYFRGAMAGMERSPSWRLTAPLRKLKAAARWFRRG